MRTADHRRGLRGGLAWLLAALALIGSVTALAACGGDDEESSAIPAFEADDLTEPAGEDWPHVGGSLANDRYSTLDEINTENVADLKGVWKTDLRSSGVEAKYSGESQPVVWNGVLYVTTGKNDVFAVDVETGKILWQYKGNLFQKITTVCCGWLNRGVAIGDGKVFQGQLDGKVVALDAKTGKRLWVRQLSKWQDGQTITSAPTYADGRLYIGVVGADLGTRSFLEALDAETGKSIWRWWAIPGPGEPGGDSWPEGTDAYLRGGGAIWNAPAYDPELGLVYVATGNAGPDWDGTVRPGDNKWTVAMVAIDAETGKTKWGFQQVRHDIWDLDAASPVVLFEGAEGRKGIAHAGKTGWLYMLDRETGEPMYGIDDKPVPQDKRQHTSPTQPIPRNGEFIPHEPVSQKEVERIKKARTKEQMHLEVVPSLEPYTPPGMDKLVAFYPGPQGGVNWQPISYNPETQMFYICSAAQTTGQMVTPGKWQRGKYYIGGTLVGVAWTESWGTFTAIDANNGRRVWQKRFPDACYSGTSTTKGNLVFNGRNTGELEAYDARNGKRLWSFQTGAGANNTATIFEHKGKQYVAFLSQGNSLQATVHGDELWLFGLDGTLGPAADPEGGKGQGHKGIDEETDEQEALPQQGDPEQGRAVYANNCSGCHGALGTGGNGGPDISTGQNRGQVIAQVTNGGGGMPAFKSELTQQQIEDVAAFVTEEIDKG